MNNGNARLMNQMRRLVPVIAAAVGGGLAVAAMLLISDHSGYPLMLIPFATSILVVFGSPEAAPAQPRALIGGHVISALVGLIALKLFGTHAWVAAFAVGMAMIAMHLTRTFHPPAGIDPILVVTHALPASFLLAPVALGAIALALFAAVWHRLVTKVPWPQRWG
jgi:CBS-domain-containing membrane protein